MKKAKKESVEHWEMVKWLSSHDVSLDEKYDLEHAPRHRKKKKPPSVASREPEEALDLHGLTVEEAASELKSFILGCKLKGCYLVKVIHGKGLHSPGEAKLKGLVADYLNHDGKNLISSWRCASPNQGGEGAVIIYY
jgi:DNA-nicking Smr family endonuclease